MSGRRRSSRCDHHKDVMCPACSPSITRPFEAIRHAIAGAGGYEWCDEHQTYRSWSDNSCAALHEPVRPPGSFLCADHGRWHDPSEQAVYCEEVPDA